MSNRNNRRGMGPFGATKPSGVRMNGKDLRSVREVTMDNYDAEYMYLRENELTDFDCEVRMEYLRVLDLSINEIGGSVDFLSRTPHLRHLYMTGNKIESLLGISNFVALETLCLSDNSISSFEGLENLPNLRVLSLNFNNIGSFEGYPTLPNLHTLNLVGNPITEAPTYRAMAIAVNGGELVSIDGNPVQDLERNDVAKYQGKVAQCIREGFMVEGQNPEKAAAAFMVKMQRNRQLAKHLQLCSINVAAMREGGEIMEGEPVVLSLCMQDIRPYEQRISEGFQSSYLFPVVFKVSGDASEVFVMGSMNGWTEPIPLERCVVDGAVLFHTTLYLPTGDYEYRYIVDGEEKVSEKDSKPSQYREGYCNIYKVAPGEPQDGEQDTILHIRWMRSAPNGVFEVIEDENALVYNPITTDCGCCLRAEVLAYVNGAFSFLYYDVSQPIKPAPPQCPRLEIVGDVVEGGVLTAEADYMGGIEGNSTLEWFRITPGGDTVPMDVMDPWAGYQVTRADIGCCIRAEFTPVRNDWVSGERRSATTAAVQACSPECRSIKIIGSLVQGGQLEVEAVYFGGEEGNSSYRWLRHTGRREEYTPIDGAEGTKYKVQEEDVGKCLAVEYTPISTDGRMGETCRCVLDNPIEAAAPAVHNVAIVGDLMEKESVSVVFEYTGGHPGAHMIQWARRDKKKVSTTKIGKANSNSVRLSNKDVGSSIEVTVVPVRQDGAVGKAVTASSNGVVEPCAPEVHGLKIVGTPAAGKELTIDMTYAGGKEGKSIVEWEVQDAENDVYDEVAKNVIKYKVKKADAGKLLKVTYTPIRSDGATGAAQSCTVQVEAAPASAPVSVHADPTPVSSTRSSKKSAASSKKSSAASTPKASQPRHHDSDSETDSEDARAAAAARPAESASEAAEPAEPPVPEVPQTPEEAPAPPQAAEPEQAGNIRITTKTHDSDEDSEL